MSTDIEEDIRTGLAYIANAVHTEPPPITTITEESARAGARRGATRWNATGTARRHRSGRLTALQFATLGLIAIGVVGLVGIVSNRSVGPAAVGQIEAHHSRVEVTIEAKLVCDRPIDNTGKFTTLVIDSYSDRVGRRWASRTTYPDGSTHDYIAFGSTIYPTRLYERGKLLSARLGCIGPNNEEFVLSINMADGVPYSLNLSPELDPDERPYIKLFNDLGKQTPGSHLDDRGRPSELWEQQIKGTSGYGNTADHATTQIEDWWVNPTDGTTITQQRFANTVDQLGTATVTATLTTDETITMPTSIFDPAGYQSLPTSPRPNLNPIDHPPLPTSPTSGP